MAGFDESKVNRDGDGKFATKGTPAEQKRFEELTNARKQLAFAIKELAAASSNGEQKKIVSVDLDTDIQKKLTAASPNERQKIAFAYIMDNLRGKYAAQDGRIVAIERVGADKITHTTSDIKIKVSPELGDLISAGTFRNVVDAEHKIFAKFAYYDVDFEIKGEIYSGVLNIGIRKNGESSLYDLNPYNKK